MQVEEKNNELELASRREQLKKYEAQLYQVKTNKEYDAIAQETETTKKAIDDLENAILTAEEKIESLKQTISDNEKTMVQLREDLKENGAELQEKINASSEEEKLLEQERSIVLSALNGNHISAYERIRAAKQGKAVAACNGGVCGGCFSYIPPQKVTEIKNMKRIYFCESCGRILVWDRNEE